jgi:hypothetical protein
MIRRPHAFTLRAGSAGGRFGERRSAERATACRNRNIAETFRTFFGGRVGGGFSAPHSGEHRVHRQHDKEIDGGSDQMNETSALIKSPIGNLLPLTVNSIAEKSGFPTMAAINGVIRSFTNAVTTAPNATPIHRDGEIENVAAEDKLSEALQHINLPLADFRYHVASGLLTHRDEPELGI